MRLLWFYLKTLFNNNKTGKQHKQHQHLNTGENSQFSKMYLGNMDFIKAL